MRHKKAQAEERLDYANTWQDNDLVYPAKDGRPWKPSLVSGAFRDLVERRKLTKVRFHDLRHTHASQLLRQGVHAKIVSERLGHSTVAITLDLYSHLLPGLQEEAVSKVEAALVEAIETRRLEASQEKAAQNGHKRAGKASNVVPLRG